ncbi:helix-turn-helix transcriptional regulator, partial [Streptomyces sp. NPDC127110]|uniref:helix-turn-helix transcriptional regulator n=1 Tax=Streptomyces sp. NPDC127110 TaxID=3345362 RepID=UPI0036324505
MSETNEQTTLFAAVDALLEEAAAQDGLPHPDERKRLREAAGLSQDQIAKALSVRRETVTSWETGRTAPRPPKRAAYARLLEGLAALHPAAAEGVNAVNAVNAVNGEPPAAPATAPTINAVNATPTPTPTVNAVNAEPAPTPEPTPTPPIPPATVNAVNAATPQPPATPRRAPQRPTPA